MSSTATEIDHSFMDRALALAKTGFYSARPNPRVGCVIVHDGKIVGEGGHLKRGGPHAEVSALAQAREKARGATAYVTLEPCNHQGLTPSCCRQLIEAGIKRVVAAMQDPNPVVRGAGFLALSEAGIEVCVGVGAVQSRQLNLGFIQRMTTGRPWIRLKIAASLDGKTALANGESQWISGTAAREDVQYWRARACAVLTGVGTIIADNPRLNVRSPRYQDQLIAQPLTVVLDNTLRIIPSACILQQPHTLIFCTRKDPCRVRALETKGAEIIELPENAAGSVDLNTLSLALGERELNEILVESGSILNSAFLQADLIDEIVHYVCPVLLGGKAHSAFEDYTVKQLSEAPRFICTELQSFPPDVRLLLRRTDHHVSSVAGVPSVKSATCPQACDV